MRSFLFPFLLAFLASALPSPGIDPLEAGFANPPDSTKPWCYWYWISDNISREGITKDLEAMKRVGIGEAFMANIYVEDVKIGNVKALTEEWWGMLEHAIREGGRLGVDIGVFNCPGWSQSGGPWIKPEQAMRHVTWTETRVKGPSRFEEKLVAPKASFQDLALLAFPAPDRDADTLRKHGPQITCTPAVEHPEQLVDGDTTTALSFTEAKGTFTIALELAEEITARSLVLVPAATDFAGEFELQALDKTGSFRKVRSFTLDRSNNQRNVGFVPYAPVSISFPAVRTKAFRLVATNIRGKPGLAEVELSGAARVERYIEKQLGKMHPTPMPRWDAYLWPNTTEPESGKFAVPPRSVQDLSGKLTGDGTLRWDVPPGEWILLRTGLIPTGTRNGPASPQGIGLEVDKMNRAAVNSHFNAYIGQLLKRLPPSDRKAFRHVVADSYEMGSQNWTDDLRNVFRKTYGYDPRPWLPVLTGRLVGSAEQSDRFLWDLRRLVADQIASEYVGGLREAAHRHGLKLWLENYGHWGYPAEFLQYGGQSDEIGGEFWASRDLGSVEVRAAASAAHTYGKPIVHSEAFTSSFRFESTPWSLKARGDWSLAEGINHWVLHVSYHQSTDQLPGVNCWWGTDFNRNNTWFYPGREWINYSRRCQFLLQQGKTIADVAYFIGEDAPKMTGIRKPDLPPGYNYDYINAEVIEKHLRVKNGRFVLPDGTSYRLLVLPEQPVMRPELLEKIRRLVAAGGALLGTAPSRSPSMKDYPACDEQVRKVAGELWANSGPNGGAYGKGRVFQNRELQPVLNALDLAPDVEGLPPGQVVWTHRTTGDAELYFVSNQSEQAVNVTPLFRVKRKAPEFWDAVTATISQPAVFETSERGIRVPLQLEPRGSLFVIFRKPVDHAPPVLQVARDGEVVLSTSPKQTIIPSPTTAGANNFTMAGWVKPLLEIGIPQESDSGVLLDYPRNDAVYPVQGAAIFGEGHACAGISPGRNGICVYEHSSNYFAPVLVYHIAFTNWTHVAVVYKDGRPSLYLNGQMVRQGLQSRYQVHSSVSLNQIPTGVYRGERGEFQEFAGALSSAQIREMAALKPISELVLPEVQLNRTVKGFEAQVTRPGTYALTLADGHKCSFEAKGSPAPLELNKPWEVHFPSNMDVPETISLGGLRSLTEHPEPAVRYFSGTARYTQTFSLPAECLAPDCRLVLDLGGVEAMAEVVLNGQNLGIFWKAPFVVDITKAAKAGPNFLEVRVTGTWWNRLIGDAKYPNGFPSANGTETRPLQFKPFLTAPTRLPGDTPLKPYGLLGPVRILTARTIPVCP